MWTDYRSFFQEATGHPPFDFQERLASSDKLPNFLNVPTGSGKTAAVILAWTWRRFFHPDRTVRKNTPRRLIYCLPMRVLVEQTRDEAKKQLANLFDQGNQGEMPGVHILMGGETDLDWLTQTDKDQIIIGTQDMLLSAALNRGYGMSRFRWPQAFGLVNSDCLWVFDEVQLMGEGVPTSAQLAAFREGLKTFGSTHSIWLSATLNQEWFQTVDFAGKLSQSVWLSLSDSDKNNPTLRARLKALKTVASSELDCSLEKDNYPSRVAVAVTEKHKPGTQTLVILNQVKRAQQVYQALEKQTPDSDILLIHSRFRPWERETLNKKLTSPIPPSGRIVVATQVIEAGVDTSSATLFTELAPWSSMVQRFGRCNRYGEYDSARIIWMDPGDDNPSPYSAEEIQLSRKVISSMENKSASPAELPEHNSPGNHKHVIRKRDIVQLFDTTPDLSGYDVDVSRFIRDPNDTDIQVFWREWEEDAPPESLPAPRQQELCSVSLWNLSSFLGKNQVAWRWDFLSDKWQKLYQRDLRPGMTLLINCNQGGYNKVTGWTGNKSDKVDLFSQSGEQPDSTSADMQAGKSQWQTIAEHTDMVVEELNLLLEKETLDGGIVAALQLAARWHDAGKAHQVFQQTMRDSGVTPPRHDTWAKTPAVFIRHNQRHFRHELASALVFLQSNVTMQELDAWQHNLAAYLMAAHHGKVRLSIRSMPEEKAPGTVSADTRIARGVWEGSEVEKADLGGGHLVPQTAIQLSPMELGAEETPSWLTRMLEIRNRLGPFRLAYLEALLRAADIRASQKARKGVSRDEEN